MINKNSNAKINDQEKLKLWKQPLHRIYLMMSHAKLSTIKAFPSVDSYTPTDDQREYQWENFEGRPTPLKMPGMVL